MVRAVEDGRRAEHGLVQLPPRARHRARQAGHRRRPHRPAVPLPRDLSAGLDHLRGRAAGRRGAVAPGRQGRRQRRDRRSAGALHRHRHVAQRTDHAGRRQNRDLRQGARPRRHRQGASPSASTTPACSWPSSPTARMGTFESTRYARGRKNFNTFELNGADGSVYFDLEEPEYLQYFEYKNMQIRQEGGEPPDRLAQNPRHQLRAPVHEPLLGARARASATSTRS